MATRTLQTLALHTCMAALLVSCGGGGGGGGSVAGSEPRVSPSGFTLSGSISLPDTAAVDSDTNDAFQTGWIRNDTAALAQPLTPPVQLLGTLNTAGSGPAGNTFSSGDEFDLFRVSLEANQTVELNFSPGIPGSDVDMALFDSSTGAVSGTSTSSIGTRECLRITRTGTYYLAPYIYTGQAREIKGAAHYSLRIGSPGESVACENSSTNTELFVSGQLVAKAKADQGELESLSSAPGRRAARAPRQPELLHVPDEMLRGPKETFDGRLSLLSLSTKSSPVDTRITAAIGTLRHAKRLQASGAYEYVEPNYILHTLASYAPTDPNYLPQRWHFEQINLPSAMERILALSNKPSTRPLVAVIDNGIIADHPDLASQIVGGYAFMSNTNFGDANSSRFDDPSTESDCSSVGCWHGTHVAGIVAALSDNARYGAGVAPMAQLMPLRVLKAGQGATSYDVGQAILYAAKLGNNSNTTPARRADVINISLGGPGSCPSVFADTISQARAQGVIVVAASGNTATVPGTPANCTGTIAVGAVDAKKVLTNYSNFGPELSLVAPGGDGRQSSTGTGYPDAIYSTIGAFSGSVRVPAFGAMTGTSMAAPHVAGVIALMRHVNPAITPAQVDTLLASGKLTDDLGASGRDNNYGYGLINARKAVDEALSLGSNGGSMEGVVIASPSSISFGSALSSATLTLSTTASTRETVTSITRNSNAVSISPSNVDNATQLGRYTISVDRTQLTPGTWYPSLTVNTSTGRTITIQLTIVKLATGNNTGASYGSLWVQAKDTASGTIVARQRFDVRAGKYNWSLSGLSAGTYTLLASTDLDNDRVFCEQGEACGDFPGTTQTLSVSGDRSGIDFSIAPNIAPSNAPAQP